VQAILHLAGAGEEAGGAVGIAFQRGEADDVVGGLGRLRTAAIAGREGAGMAERQAGGAAGADAIGERGLYGRRPAAHHLFQPPVQRLGIGAHAVRAQRDGVA
jgi:hypothetical protein